MRILDRLVPWIVGAFAVTVAIAAVYLSLQQLNRSAADDAGDRLASQVTSAGGAGGGAGGAGAAAHVDLATSLAPFFVVYDRSGVPVSGTGYLDGRLARIPAGVVRTALAEGMDRVTWQPRPGLRFATVAQKDGDRVVVAGQSLKPVEDRIDRLGLMLVVGWIAAVFLLAVGAGAHLWLGSEADARAAGTARPRL
jgi:hypothetical protein